MTQWVTVSQASDILGMSERSVRRHISDGRLESKTEGRRRLVRVDVGSDNLVISGMTVADKDALIKWLQNELEERSKQIERLQEEIRRNQERSDTIILRLADELEAQRALFEGKKPRRKRDESLWQRLRRADSEDEK